MELSDLLLDNNIATAQRTFCINQHCFSQAFLTENVVTVGADGMIVRLKAD